MQRGHKKQNDGSGGADFNPGATQREAPTPEAVFYREILTSWCTPQALLGAEHRPARPPLGTCC